VKRIAWDRSARCRVQTHALRDAFIHEFGTSQDLWRAHGLSADRIVATALEA
jgi:transketolase